MPTRLEHDPAADTASAMDLFLRVQDPETLKELSKYAEGPERERFALMALRIGAMAVSQAQGSIDASEIRSESQRILLQLQSHLQEHAQTTHMRLKDLLAHYFDPNSGQFQDRVESLISKDGKLEALLEKKIGQGDSELSQTLCLHLGRDSRLMKALDPEQSQGLISQIRTLLDQQLASQREKVMEQFSLDNQSSALARLVAQLTEQQGQLTTKLQHQIDGVVAQFSLDREDSALSKLVRNVERAQSTITSEFSLDDRESALARMKRELVEMLEKSQLSNQRFQEEVKVTLQALAARKEESKRSTRHGLEFEDAVAQWLTHEAPPAGDLVERTGNRPGAIKACKVGDFVVQLGPEHVAAGARIVVEAKQKEGVSLASAREELEEARKNRQAQIGLFVFSRRTAPEPVEPLQRIGSDIFCAWDPEDPQTDIFLKSALTVARALCVAQSNLSHEIVDLQRLEHAILAVENGTTKFDDMERWVETIQSSSRKLHKSINSARRDLADQVEHLHDVLQQLKHSV